MCLINRNIWAQNANWMSVFLSVLYPDFQLSLSLPLFYTFFLIRMLLLDLLASKLILILNFSNKFQRWFTMNTKACFARSKSMDLNDFFIPSNALDIRLSRDLITQSRGDGFHKYINKGQLFYAAVPIKLCILTKLL